jgi:RNA polymerase sigma-70 factor (ECF subfamily)
VQFREAVVLRDLEDLTYEEIAEVLGVRIGTVRSRIARGRLKLRDVLEEEAT